MFDAGFSISIDQIVIFGLGFLVCSVIALIPIPLVHARAVRLTEKRLAFANPVAMKDIQAEKDMMRAQFAMTARRLESSIEELKNKAGAHLGDLAKKSNVIARMKAALEEREAEIARLEAANGALEARVRTLFDDLQIARAEIGLKNDELAQAERVLAHSRNQANDLRLANEEREHVLARQAQEIAALKAHIETVRSRIVEFAQDVRQSENLLTYEPDPLMRVASPTLNGATGLGKSGGRSIGPGGGLQLNGAE
ncbi:MAG TPA: hypothetical protein VHA55_00775 [Pseudorhodoplanes sp.]|jgi:hypothetical protein|nr:hypothetical protein [Pseudorhodoplanes sp.]